MGLDSNKTSRTGFCQSKKKKNICSTYVREQKISPPRLLQKELKKAKKKRDRKEITEANINPSCSFTNPVKNKLQKCTILEDQKCSHKKARWFSIKLSNTLANLD